MGAGGGPAGKIGPVSTLRKLKKRLRPVPLIQDLEVRDLIDRALEFQTTLLETKAGIAPRDFDWYPYDSFGTLSLLDPLLSGRARFPRSLIGSDPVLDVGCGDGVLSFFFESLGYEVHALDNPPSNFNRMQGARALRAALKSSVRIEAADVDSQFRLPVRRCGLALFFGVLYHLKNPLGALEALAASARWCLLSTAVARHTPDGNARIDGAPLAYLAGRDGLNGDETNYWIFSEQGLRVLVDRAGWEVRDLDGGERSGRHALGRPPRYPRLSACSAAAGSRRRSTPSCLAAGTSWKPAPGAGPSAVSPWPSRNRAS